MSSIITLPDFASAAEGAAHFFGTRHGGSLPPGEHGNRDVASTEQCLTAEKSPLRDLLAGCSIASVTQVHGTDALVVDDALPSREMLERGWDALVTDRAGVCLTIKTADCVPVLVHDPVRGVVAAIHAGWRGAVAGILPKTLALMGQRFGSAAEHLRIGIGPAAGVCCYEVDGPVLGRLRAEFPEWQAVVQGSVGDRAKLHLRELVRRQAAAAGVSLNRIRAVERCTICEPDLFYSYRREGRGRGTMVSGIMLSV